MEVKLLTCWDVAIFHGDFLSCRFFCEGDLSRAISGTDLLEVPTIYKAYFLGLCKGISPQNMVLYGTVAPF